MKIMHSISFNGFTVEVWAMVEDKDWRNDTVLIYNDIGCISDSDIQKIIEYLYGEGFIEDRRTKYFIIDGDKK